MHGNYVKCIESLAEHVKTRERLQNVNVDRRIILKLKV
jgi:hypothetical protein